MLRRKLNVALTDSDFERFLVRCLHFCFCFQEDDCIRPGRLAIDQHVSLDAGSLFFIFGSFHFMVRPFRFCLLDLRFFDCRFFADGRVGFGFLGDRFRFFLLLLFGGGGIIASQCGQELDDEGFFELFPVDLDGLFKMRRSFFEFLLQAERDA